MLKNFRNGVLAQLVLLAFVGCSMTLHATSFTCTNTIALGAGGFVLDSQITRGTCVQVGDKLFGGFNFRNLPANSLFGFSFAANGATFSIQNFNFAIGTAYTFGYSVEVTNPANVITTASGDVIQSLGSASLSATVTPAGMGMINFTRVGSGASSPNTVTFTEGQKVTLVTFNETFTKGTGSNSTSLLNSIQETRVPEPASIWLLSSGMLGLASLRRRRSLKK